MSVIKIIDESRVDVLDIVDSTVALGTARHMAADVGFNEIDQYLIATAVSELATNIVKYAKEGYVLVRIINDGERDGLEVQAKDFGPGINDINLAMQENFSTGNTLGMGLPGVKRIMDEFHLESKIGKGTNCTARKWRVKNA